MTALDVFFLLVALGPTVPAFVVGRRCGVRHAGLAFVPIFGPTIVILRSIERSAWMCLLSFVPLVSLFFVIWLVIAVPSEHGRTRWWVLPFLIPFVQVAAFYAYAFTLTQRASDARPALAA